MTATTTVEMPRPIRGVAVAREIIGLIVDCTCGPRLDEECMRLSIAARWPDPHPWHALDDD